MTGPAAVETADCSVWGVCGGCVVDATTRKPAPYTDQLAEKDRRVRELLAPFTIDTWHPILPSPDLYHYRNKMEFAFAPHYVRQEPTGSPESIATPATPKGKKEKPIYVMQEPLRLGLRQQGKFDQIVDVDSCQIFSKPSMDLLETVRSWAKRQGLTGYDRRRFQGDLRYLVVREGKHTGERMGILLASDTVKSNLAHGTDALNQLIERTRPFLSTLLLGYVRGTNDQARTDDIETLYGDGMIHETLLGLKYRISPFSFFQSNPTATEGLYRLLQNWAKERGGAILDLYCGSGGIGIAMAPFCDRVLGVDSNRDSIVDAKANAELNGLTNTEFVAQETEDFLDRLDASQLTVQLSGVVIDPPRPGLHPKAMKTLLELNPVAIAYVSCNPESLARDLSSLVPFYHIRSAQAVDLFPHTHHVESVVFLEHR